MAYKSKFTGVEVDNLLIYVQTLQQNPDAVLQNMTGQAIIDKINSVTGNIVFTKFVDAQAGAGKSV
jgi:hypothetical protein